MAMIWNDYPAQIATNCVAGENGMRGQGILLSLADIGLTEEVAFPERNRIQLEVTCKKKIDPDKALWDDGTTDVDLPTQLKFNVVLIRQNQLFKGDIMGTRFVFLNENT